MDTGLLFSKIKVLKYEVQNFIYFLNKINYSFYTLKYKLMLSKIQIVEIFKSLYFIRYTLFSRYPL